MGKRGPYGRERVWDRALSRRQRRSRVNQTDRLTDDAECDLREGKISDDRNGMYRQPFFSVDFIPWKYGDETTTEATEEMRRTHWPVVEEQRLWLAVVKQAVEESQHPSTEISAPAREFILSKGFRAIVGAIELRSEHHWSVTAIRARLRRVWR